MTIDERLERLTERHDALAATVELVAAEIRDVVALQQQHKKQFGEVMNGIARLTSRATNAG